MQFIILNKWFEYARLLIEQTTTLNLKLNKDEMYKSAPPIAG